MLEFDLVDEPDEQEVDSLEATMREFGEDAEPAPRPVKRRPAEQRTPAAEQRTPAAESPPERRRVRVTARAAPAKRPAKRKRAEYIPLDEL